MYSEEEKTRIKELIVKKIRQLTDQVVELVELTRPIAPDVAIGRISRMDAINNKSVNEAALRQARHKLDGLEHALDRIDTPEFGRCANCGKTIPAGRIMVMPESRYCIQCG